MSDIEDNTGLIDEIELARKVIRNEDENIGDMLPAICEDTFFKFMGYLNNQVTNLEKFAYRMMESVPQSDLSSSFIQSYIDELRQIKKDLDKDIEGALILKEDPKQNFNGYLISITSRVSILNDSIRRLQRVRKSLEGAHDGLTVDGPN